MHAAKIQPSFGMRKTIVSEPADIFVAVASTRDGQTVEAQRYARLCQVLMAERGLDHAGVAALLGISSDYVGKIIRGDRNGIGADVVRKACDALGMSSGYFFEGYAGERPYSEFLRGSAARPRHSMAPTSSDAAALRDYLRSGRGAPVTEAEDRFLAACAAADPEITADHLHAILLARRGSAPKRATDHDNTDPPPARPRKGDSGPRPAQVVTHAIAGVGPKR